MSRLVRLEALLTKPEGFGLTTATPVQRAICRIADGRPLRELADHPDVIDALGGEQAIAALPSEHGEPPRWIYLLAGVRGGKSLISSAAAVAASQNVDLSQLRSGEPARVALLSLDLDKARAVYGHMTGSIQASRYLRALLTRDPTDEAVQLRHPARGQLVDVRVVAGKRAGAAVVSYWLAGLIADEAPRMLGQEDGVVNLDDTITAALGRLLPGGQGWLIGSPWAPRGPVYEAHLRYFGRPADGVVVIRGRGWQMNPSWWTPARCAELEQADPLAYRTDVLAEFADPEDSLLSSDDLRACTRDTDTPLPYDPRCTYVAVIDPATRGNAWTLGIGHREGPRIILDLARQWIGSSVAPLRPREVMPQIASLCHGYHVAHLTSDQYSVDALRDEAERNGLTLLEDTITEANKLAQFTVLRLEATEHRLSLPNDRALVADLGAIRRRVTQSGSVSIIQPRTADGRHADYASMMALLVTRPLPDRGPEPPSRQDEEFERLQRRLLRHDREPDWSRPLDVFLED